ncbi:hypothetical protein SAMN05216344_102207 [Polaromonas sp. OV174]|uniref:hypothetical protein n=1 Tax=Polaromonas sp. OV174 TaxID=1855300 RepID=UPI0008DED360|nr:hypothetical protein [Polaromonas sp. OV174]SFB74610.1 hypothetical protein SAMN05216344_102207 [Polaromonas sp. OV174]
MESMHPYYAPFVDVMVQVRAAIANGTLIRPRPPPRVPHPLPVIDLPPHNEAEALEADMAIHRWKESGGPLRDRDAKAMRLQNRYSKF